jgi:hypothetical protein
VVDAEQERKRAAALEAGMLEEVRASLPQQPPRVFHMHGPGKRRTPTEPEIGGGSVISGGGGGSGGGSGEGRAGIGVGVWVTKLQVLFSLLLRIWGS